MSYEVKGNKGKGRNLANTIAKHLEKVSKTGVVIDPFRFGTIVDSENGCWRNFLGDNGDNKAVCLRGGLVLGKKAPFGGNDLVQIATEFDLTESFVLGMEMGFMGAAQYEDTKVKRFSPYMLSEEKGYRIGVQVFNHLVNRGIPVTTRYEN